MQDSWQAFLKGQGATIKDNGDVDFDNNEINVSETPITTVLSEFSCLAVTGEDRHAFLHGQFINDLNHIEEPAAQISAWCNPKGQVITNFLVINTGIAYLLIFKNELKEFVQKRLSLFIMRSDVNIDDISESSPLLGLNDRIDFSEISTNISTTAGAVMAIDGLIIICHPDESGRYLMTGSIEALSNSIPKLNSTLVSSHFWGLLDILSGMPWVSAITQEQFLPQMLNLDALKGLSYQKGCYPGQEVIARLHYRGEVKKRMRLIKSSTTLIAGENLYISHSDTKVGTLINSCLHVDGYHYALAVVNIDPSTESLSNELDANNNILELELPYQIDNK